MLMEELKSKLMRKLTRKRPEQCVSLMRIVHKCKQEHKCEDKENR